MNPEVSVILPFFNAEKTLSKAIESILNQTYPNFELLLIDNNSTDQSGWMAKKFAGQDSRIKIFKERNNGVAHAMNCGLKNSSGRFLGRMDADDISFADRFEKQVKFLKENPDTGMVGSGVKYVSNQNNTEGFQRFVDWVNSFYTAEEIEINRFIEIPVVNPTILFRREVYEKYGGCIQGDFPEDYEMLLRFLEAGIKMEKLNEPLLEWHDYSTRLTRNDQRYSTDAFLGVKAKYFKMYSEKHNLFHPEIWIWGAGRKTRQRAGMLEKEGLIIKGFIDVVKRKTTVKNVIHFREIPDPGKWFVVSMVTNPGAGVKIRNFLKDRNYKEGKDFMLLG
jgi:glycosyltransferase involved in cell wall biosynthesis